MPESAAQGVLRGLTTTALLWIPLWILAQSGLWPVNQPGPVPATALWVVVGSWLLLLVTHLRTLPARWPVRLTVGSLVIAVISVNLGQLRLAVPDTGLVAEMAALAAGIAGLLLPWRWGVGWAIVMALPLVRDGLTVGSSIGGLTVQITYVMTVGVAAVAVRQALLRSAEAADVAAGEAFAAEDQRDASEQVERFLQDTERRLHETALNTLVSVARGGALGAESLRERCAESARMLTALASGTRWTSDDGASGDLASDVEHWIEDLRGTGVTVMWDAPDISGLPTDVYVAVRTAVIEALSNAGRHAEARSVRVGGDWSGAGDATALRIVVEDDGMGFVPSTARGRFGVAEAILAPMADVGGTAVIDSDVGDGTRVTLRWQRGESPRASSPVSPAALAVPLLIAVSVYLLTMVVVTWPSFDRPGLNGLAVLLYAGGVTGVMLLTNRARLSWPVVMGLAALGWVVYTLQTMAAGFQTFPEWSSSAVAVLFMVAAATGPRWAWVVLVGVWLAFQGDPLYEVTQPGTAMILVGALLGRSTRRNAARAAAMQRDRADAASARDASRARLDRMSIRYGALALSSAPGFLRDLADGALSPESDDVRARAVREENFIRSIIRIDPGLDPLHTMAAALSGHAYRREVLLDVDLAAAPSEGVRVAEGFVVSCAWALDNAQPTRIVDGHPVGTTARLSSRQEGEAVVVRLLAPVPIDVDPAAVPGHGILLDPDDPAGPVYLWEDDVATEVETRRKVSP